MSLGGVDSNHRIGGQETEGVGGVKGTTDGAGGGTEAEEAGAPAQFNKARMAASGQAAQLAQMARMLEAEEKMNAGTVQSQAKPGKSSADELSKAWAKAKGDGDVSSEDVKNLIKLAKKDGLTTGDLDAAKKNWASEAGEEFEHEAREIYETLAKEYYDKHPGETPPEVKALQDGWEKAKKDGVVGKKDGADLTGLAKKDGVVTQAEVDWAKKNWEKEKGKGVGNEKAAEKLYRALEKQHSIG